MKLTDTESKGRAANGFASFSTKGTFHIKKEPRDNCRDSCSGLSLNINKSQITGVHPVYGTNSLKLVTTGAQYMPILPAFESVSGKATPPIANAPSELVDYFGAYSGAYSSKRGSGDSSSRMVRGTGGGMFVTRMGTGCSKILAMSGISNVQVAMALENKIRELKYRGEEREKFRIDSSLKRQGSSEESKASTEDDDDEMNQSDEEDEFIDEEYDEDEDLSFDEEDGGVNAETECPRVFGQQLVYHKSMVERSSGGGKNSTFTTDLQLPGTSQSIENPEFMGSKLLTCSDCDKVFMRQLDLNRHRLRHIAEKSFKCTYCDKSFAFSFNLKSHERMHTGEKPYICEECSEAYMHAVDLRTHQQVHSDQSRYVCSICTKTFSLKTKYLIHVRRHNSVKPFKCNMCGKAFHRPASLRAHELLHSVETEERPYPCRFCERTFMRSAHKQMHERVHLDEKPYPCANCGNAFGDASQLKTHICIQSNLQKFWCDICKRTFPSLTALDSHTKTHMVPKLSVLDRNRAMSAKPSGLKRRNVPRVGKKAFPCKLCNQGFQRKKNLEEHEKIHQREYTPYMCPECFLTFTHSNYLKLHLQMHKTQKLLQCKLCSQKFPTEGDLQMHGRMHVKTDSAPDSLACDMCDNKYETEADLQAHRHIHQVLQAGSSRPNSTSPKAS